MLHVQGRLQRQGPCRDAPERPFQEFLSTQQTERIHLTPTLCTPHCQGSCTNPTTQTTMHESAVSTRALQEACASIRSTPAPDLSPKTPVIHPPTRLGVGEMDTVVLLGKLLPQRATQGAEGALGLEEEDMCSGFPEPATKPLLLHQ